MRRLEGTWQAKWIQPLGSPDRSESSNHHGPFYVVIKTSLTSPPPPHRAAPSPCTCCPVPLVTWQWGCVLAPVWPSAGVTGRHRSQDFRGLSHTGFSFTGLGASRTGYTIHSLPPQFSLHVILNLHFQHIKISWPFFMSFKDPFPWYLRTLYPLKMPEAGDGKRPLKLPK